MPLVDLLCDEEDKKNEVLTVDYFTDGQIIESIQLSSVETKRRILSYLEQWILKEHIKVPNGNVSIIADADGNKVVVINDGSITNFVGFRIPLVATTAHIE